MPTPPIHAPAWNLGWHSKCHESKMEDIQIPYRLLKGTTKVLQASGERHTPRKLAAVCAPGYTWRTVGNR